MKKTITKALLVIVCTLILIPVFSQNQLVGTVNYHDNPGVPIPEVVLDLYDFNNNMILSTMTNDMGEYSFDSIPNGNYYLIPSTSLLPGEVTLQDAYVIMMYLFGFYDFTDCEFAAADVNASGTVTWTDYFIVLIDYILQGQPFPTDNWQFQFVEVDFTSRTIGTVDTASVWATGSGDLEGIWNPTGRSLPLVEGNNDHTIVLSNETTEIVIQSNYTELISGFNLNLQYPNELMTITGVEGPDGNLNYSIEGDVIKIVWMDESAQSGSHVYGDCLCTLLVNKRLGITGNNMEVVNLGDNGMLIDAFGQPIEGTEIQLPTIAISEDIPVAKAVVYPNPVANLLNISFYSPDQFMGNLFIYNMNGQLVKQTTVSANAKGNQNITVPVASLFSGSYSYRVIEGFSSKELISGQFFKAK